MTDLTPAVLAAKLSDRAEDVARWLLPGGKRIAHDWCAGSIKGEEGQSLKVALEGDNRGRWADFAVKDQKGDLLDLICATQDMSLGEAIKEACEFLGIERLRWSRNKEKYAEPERPKQARALRDTPSVEAFLATRKISSETAAKFRLCADGTNTLVFPYFREGKLRHLKYRDIRQKKFWSSAGTEKCLFGWQALEPTVRAVALTEGELDTLALAEYGFQAMSLPYGAGTKDKQDWIENEWEHLERFDTIYIAIDMDGAGLQTVQELAGRLGRERCKVVRLPRKDANACLMADVPKSEILAAFRAAKTLDPVELRRAGEFTEQVIERFHPVSDARNGFLMPWLSMAEAFTFEWGATTIIAGYSGHGKSETVGQIVADAKRQGIRACVGSFEFKASKWIQRMVRQITCNERPTHAHIHRAMEWLDEGVWAIDSDKTTRADALLAIFDYAHRRYGIRLFIVDNFSKLGIADDDLAEQKRVINAFTEFSRDKDVHMIIVHHLRKEETDYSATNMSKLSLKGSSALGDLVDNIFLVWRNRMKEKKMKDAKFLTLSDEEKDEIRGMPDTVITTEKMRNGDDEPRLPLWFDRRSHLWIENPNGRPYLYVPEQAKA